MGILPANTGGITTTTSRLWLAFAPKEGLFIIRKEGSLLDNWRYDIENFLARLLTLGRHSPPEPKFFFPLAFVYLCREAPYPHLPDRLARSAWGQLVLEAALTYLRHLVRAGTARYLPEAHAFVLARGDGELLQRLFDPTRNHFLAEYESLRPTLERWSALELPEPPCRRPTSRFRRVFGEKLAEDLRRLFHESEGLLAPDLRRAALLEPLSLAAVYVCARLREGVTVDDDFLDDVERLRRTSRTKDIPQLRYFLLPSCHSS